MTKEQVIEVIKKNIASNIDDIDNANRCDVIPQIMKSNDYAASWKSITDKIVDEMDDQDDNGVHGRDEQKTGPEGRRPLPLPEIPDPVDAGQGPEEAEDHQVVVGADEVARGQAVEDGEAQGQLVAHQERQDEGPGLEGDGVLVGLGPGQGAPACRAADGPGQDEGGLVEGQAPDEEDAGHPEALLGLVPLLDRAEVEPEGHEEHREKEEARGEVGEP